MRSLVLTIFLSTISAASAHAELLLGLNGEPFSKRAPSFVQQINFLEELGLRSYRVKITSIMQANGLSTLVNTAKLHGIRIHPVIAPRFNLSTSSSADLYKWSYNFSFKLVARFKDDIDLWELGGLNLWRYTHQWNKASAVLKGLSDGAQSANPHSRRAMGAAGVSPIDAFELMKRANIKWDISVWQITGDDPENAFKSLSAHGKPIWIAEFYQPGGINVKEQANNLSKWVDRLRELAAPYNVEGAHIYEPRPHVIRKALRRPAKQYDAR